ncbi:MAG: hypothetical protein IKD72_00410 [Clostridia bacterium]|nr:hypothetical protein [Clostridia bacterium]
MKKTFTILLTFALLLSTVVPLMAFAGGGTILFDGKNEYGEYFSAAYTVLGEAKNGEQTIGEEYSGFLFTAPADGWYLIDMDDTAFSEYWIVTDDLNSNRATAVRDYAWLYEGEYYAGDGFRAYEFKAGETQLIAVNWLPAGTSVTLTIRSLGTLTALRPSNLQQTYLLDDEIRPYPYGNDPDRIQVDYLVFSAVFSEGGVCTVRDVYVRGRLAPGDITLTAMFGALETEFTMHCVYFTDLVVSVALPADYVPVAKEYYNGYHELLSNLPATMTVTFTDGSVQTVPVTESDWIHDREYGAAQVTAPDGSLLSFDIIYADSDEFTGVVAYAGRSDYCVALVECTLQKASLLDNLRHYFNRLGQLISFVRNTREPGFTALAELLSWIGKETRQLFAGLF